MAKDKKLEEIEKLARTLSVAQIAAILNINVLDFVRRVNEVPEYQAAVARGRAKAINKVADVVLQQAMDGSLPAAKYYLGAMAGWRETGEVEKPQIEQKVVLDYQDAAL
jgi:hypothetical protein